MPMSVYTVGHVIVDSVVDGVVICINTLLHIVQTPNVGTSSHANNHLRFLILPIAHDHSLELRRADA